MNKPVVITGIGAVSPLGIGVHSTWIAALAGRSGLGPLTQSVLPNIPCIPVCEVKNFDPAKVMSKKEVKQQDRYQHLALAAAAEAMESSSLMITEANADRVGVIISACSGGYQTFEEELLTVQVKGQRACSPRAISKIMPNGASALVSMKYGITGPSAAVCSACASSADAIGYGLMLLRAGICDVVLVGGAEASLHSVSIASFGRMGLLSSRSSATPSPFCRQRDGLVIGEGAAVLVLETLAHAQSRDACILAELAGYSATSDAHHITSPSESGKGAAQAIKTALKDAQINADQVNYVNAHGTGTKMNDAMETNALKLALGNHAFQTPVSSTKSMTGHMMGATSALELIFAVMAIRDSVIPPTINYLEHDPECDLDYVPNTAREMPVNVAISNAFGFGGHNSVLVVKAFC
ncbi:beta-ketoacyl-[acyl-carrier-protein] synthase family protein [Nitrosomonas sp. wSCUT-2]